MKTPAKTKAALNASRVAAAKTHRKVYLSLRYIITHMPEPCLEPRSITCREYIWPAQPGLTKGRKISGSDRIMLTMSIVTRNGNLTNSWQKYAYPQSFLKALKPYLPDGLLVNSDWDNWKDRAGSTDDMKGIAVEFEEFVNDYMNKIETLLAASYIQCGDRNGKAYLEILARKFRISGWNTNPTTVRFNAKAEVPSNSEDTEDQKATTVTFNFETVLPNENDKP